MESLQYNLNWFLARFAVKKKRKALSPTFILIVPAYVRLVGTSLRSDQIVVNSLNSMGYKMDYAVLKQIVSLPRKTQYLFCREQNSQV